YLPASRRAYLRVEEFASSVTYRCDKLGRELGAAAILNTDDSLALWAEIRDAAPLKGLEALWRVSVPPSAGPSILENLARLNLSGFLDWGGGLVWLGGAASTENHDAVTRAAQGAGGVWWLVRGPEPLRAAVDVLPPESPALAAISQRVRHSFDPRGILNPLKLRAA
ncbi:MAG: FAD-binding oxidoreductase, partial [Acidocella sp.]|nr:FAD-binding oxidoreductase [Acidocella sp.]